MPKLWTETIDAHRQAVRDATLDATANLVSQHGLASVTMSQIAETTGIGRATLYKYFPDLNAVLLAWHERQIGAHLGHLQHVRSHAGGGAGGLKAVLEAYAEMSRSHGGGAIHAILHQGPHVIDAERRLTVFIHELLVEGAERGEIRNDIPADELAAYCLHALSAAGGLSSKAAVTRLITLILAGLGSSG